MEENNICEKIEEGLAYRQHLPYDIGKKAIGQGYMQEEGVFLCEAQCPYGNAGKIMHSCDSNTGIVRVCESGGLINKKETTH